MNEINSVVLNQHESFVSHALLYGKNFFKDEVNWLISNAAIDFIVSLKIVGEIFYRF